MDRYLEDEPEDEKVFMLAGDWSDNDEKCQVYKNIVSLGGRFIEHDVWNSSCTHVITKTFDMTEKLMGAMAAGRWAVTKRFIEKSIKNGDWVKARAYVIDDAVLQHRRKWFNKGSAGAAFHKMKIVFILDPDQSLKKEVYTRIVRSGDGTVLDAVTLETLVNGNIGLDEMTHIVVDPSILEDKHPKAKLFKEWMEIVEKREEQDGKKVWHVYYRFLTDKLQRPGVQGTEEKFDIFNENVQAQAKKAREMEALYGTRVRDVKNMKQVKKTNNSDGGVAEILTLEEEDVDTPASIDDLIGDIDDENPGEDNLDKDKENDVDGSKALDEIEMFLEGRDKIKEKPESSIKKSKPRKKKSKDTENVELEQVSQKPYVKKRIRQSLKDINFDEDSDEDVEWKDSKSEKKRSRRKSSKGVEDEASLPAKVLPRPSRSSRNLSLSLRDISSGEE